MLANMMRGEALIKLSDGRELMLVLDMETLFAAETIYRRPLPQMFADAGTGLFGAIAAILAGGLSEHHPEMTRAAILPIVSSDTQALMDGIARAAAGAFPDKVGAEGKDSANPSRSGKKRTGKV